MFVFLCFILLLTYTVENFTVHFAHGQSFGNFFATPSEEDGLVCLGTLTGGGRDGGGAGRFTFDNCVGILSNIVLGRQDSDAKEKLKDDKGNDDKYNDDDDCSDTNIMMTVVMK